MAEQKPSQKRLLVDKANSRIVITTASASFIVMFCLVAAVTLIGQLNYQNRVIGAKKEALTTLEQNITATNELVGRYEAFTTTPLNAIGGDPLGQGEQDGENAKIVLDALPSKYDFPALATSLEKMLKAQNVKIESIGGTDDEIAQAGSATATPQPIAIPFQISATGKYPTVRKVVDAFERSIRPIKIQTIQITGSESRMTININAETYYQPEKTLQIRTEVVK